KTAVLCIRAELVSELLRSHLLEPLVHLTENIVQLHFRAQRLGSKRFGPSHGLDERTIFSFPLDGDENALESIHLADELAQRLAAECTAVALRGELPMLGADLDEEAVERAVVLHVAFLLLTFH